MRWFGGRLGLLTAISPPSRILMPTRNRGKTMRLSASGAMQLHTAFQALCAIRSDVSAQLIVVGTGPDESRYRQLCRSLNVSDQVHFLGWIPGSELATLRQQSDVVAIPSLVPEMTSIVGLEAMASARAVVSSDVGALPEVIEHGKTGFITPAGDVDRFGEYLLRLLRSPDLTYEMGRAGRRRVEREFNLRNHTAKVEDVYGRFAAA